MFLGLRTIIYPAADLDASKAWFSGLLGFGPYFDEPFYVGYSVGGYELGLDPNAPAEEGAVTYWGVENAEAGLAALVAAGATERFGVTEVGEGIKVARAQAPTGDVIGIIENPHFELPG